MPSCVNTSDYSFSLHLRLIPRRAPATRNRGGHTFIGIERIFASQGGSLLAFFSTISNQHSSRITSPPNVLPRTTSSLRIPIPQKDPWQADSRRSFTIPPNGRVLQQQSLHQILRFVWQVALNLALWQSSLKKKKFKGTRASYGTNKQHSGLA
eukprot:Protomagalhaensia_sp_Gyna_25__4716@NODE_458_length_3383_cov_14_138457_g353_i0_p3_GENE_NODE_458_length_3383_cov_14_138457_g353_i0NODE_458_length_3383_cov_14_138457_g353_i0_p3_ORF_typecomplete_len153_score19_22SelK_SelG/PF10961_8/1_9e03SelK_SelG/PF10961_8/0_26_NODE_458_length_3383_cov_14_138457_g353_i026243082